jgi:hypothetical protein
MSTTIEDQTVDNSVNSDQEDEEIDQFLQFLTIDELGGQTFLHCPEKFYPLQEKVEKKLVGIFSGQKSVQITPTILNQVENLLNDSLVLFLGYSIAKAYEELTESSASSSTTFDIDNFELIAPGDLPAIQAETCLVTKSDKHSANFEQFFGKGELFQDPKYLLPITQSIKNASFKSDILPLLQPFLHLFNTFSPTSFDITSPIELTTATSSPSRPSLPGFDFENAQTSTVYTVTTLSTDNYYLSQAILRQYPIIVDDSTPMNEETPPAALLEPFLAGRTDQEIAELTQGLSGIETPTLTEAQIGQLHSQYSYTACSSDDGTSEAGDVKQYVTFFDAISNRHYNVSNTVFAPTKTQLMYAMVIGAPIEVINQMLHLGTNWIQPDENGWTALRWAFERVLFGREYVYETFGLFGYIQPGNFNPIRELADEYDQVQFILTPRPRNEGTGAIRVVNNLPASNPQFNEDLKRFIKYFECIENYIKNNAAQADIIHQASLPSPSITLENRLETLSYREDGNIEIELPPDQRKKDEPAEPKETTMTAEELTAMISAAPYHFNGAKFDESLKENDDFMFVNLISAIYMCHDNKIVTDLCSRLGTVFDNHLHKTVQDRRNQWYLYPDLASSLCHEYVNKVSDLEEKTGKYTAQLADLEAESVTIQSKLDEYIQLEKITPVDLAAKRIELQKAFTECARADQQLVTLQDEFQQVFIELSACQSDIQAETRSYFDTLAEQKQKYSADFEQVKNNILKQRRILKVPQISRNGDSYSASLYPGVVEPFSIRKVINQTASNIIDEVSRLKNQPDPLLDGYPDLDPNIDVSNSNPNHYELFTTLYQHFITDHPQSVPQIIDPEFAKTHEDSLLSHYKLYIDQYPSQVDFWKGMLSTRAALLSSSMIRMYQLETAVKKYKTRLIALVDDINDLDGKFAFILDHKMIDFSKSPQTNPSPPSLPPEEDQKAIVSRSSSKKPPKVVVKAATSYETAVPTSFKDNYCWVCKEVPKIMITTCCFTVLSCKGCTDKIKKCPQCGKKSPQLKQIKFG